MSKPETIRHQWTDYSTRIWRGMNHISEAQRNETKQAFYAGAYSLLMAIAGLGEDDVSEDAGAAVLEAYKQELEAFHISNINRRTGRDN